MPDRASAVPFPATRWSVVLSARAGGHPAASQAAMEELCRLYWRPLYAFARGSGLTAEDAEDRTQDFFARVVVGQDLFASAQPILGKLRTFLLTAFRHDLIDAHRATRRQKRGSANIIPLDLLAIEQRLSPALTTAAEPMRLFEREWAESVLRVALGRLGEWYEADGKADLFRLLRPFISMGHDGAASYDELSTATGLAKPAVRQAVHRLRSRFRDALRVCIADTLDQPTETQIDEELLSLQNALRS